MLLWIAIACTAYFLSALASTIDKILLTRRIPDPFLLAFYTGLSSAGIIIIVPFGGSLWALDSSTIALALASGVFFLAAIYFLFSALRRSEVSRIMPVYGAASPLFILIFAYFFKAEMLTHVALGASGLFVAGGVLLSLERKKNITYIDSSFMMRALLAAFFLAATLFVSKIVYRQAGKGMFIPAYVWSRFGSFATALFVLAFGRLRRRILAPNDATTTITGALFVTNKIIGAAGFMILNYAISLGSVVVINAMRGVEFLFVFLLTLFFSMFMPRVLRESIDRKSMLFKIVGMACIALGFIILGINDTTA